MCKDCGNEIRTLKTFRKHFLKHRKPKPNKSKKVGSRKIRKKRIHSCVICDQVFANQSELSQHIQVHGDGPFLCKYCGKEKPSIETLKAKKIKYRIENLKYFLEN